MSVPRRFISRQSVETQHYGQSLNPDLCHLPDKGHVEAGRQVARFVDQLIREANPDAPADAKLCSGCTMLTLFNAALLLARDNNQHPLELARTMEKAYGDLRQFLEAQPTDIEYLTIDHISVVPNPPEQMQ